MGVEEITKEIVVKLIEANAFNFEQYPDAKTYTDMVCAAYAQIKKIVSRNYDN